MNNIITLPTPAKPIQLNELEAQMTRKPVTPPVQNSAYDNIRGALNINKVWEHNAPTPHEVLAQREMLERALMGVRR